MIQERNQSFEFFHNSCVIRRIEQEKITKKLRDLTRNWNQDHLLGCQVL